MYCTVGCNGAVRRDTGWLLLVDCSCCVMEEDIAGCRMMMMKIGRMIFEKNNVVITRDSLIGTEEESWIFGGFRSLAGSFHSFVLAIDLACSLDPKLREE